jgi:acetyltransferase-like isoleucine patch superfamily enzyme
MAVTRFQKALHRVLSLWPKLTMAVRIALLRVLGMRIGANTRIGNISANSPWQVAVGDGCNIEDQTVFKYAGNESLNPSIHIGNRCYLGNGVVINCVQEVRVGDDVMIAAGTQLIDTDHSFESRITPTSVQPGRTEPIRIASNVWIGANVIVLRGVQIGKGSIVGAGSVVTKNVGEWEVWAGAPARFMRERP